jgi:dTDP-4-amino-4,6-dideoxygalactose transaminase
MIKKLPIAAVPVDIKDALSLKPASQNKFAAELSSYIGAKHVHLLDSGVLALYEILKALKRLAAKNEVILPAFTAGSLIVAIKKSGLRPVLCDVSMDDFNMDMPLAGQLVGKDTLAVLGIHMFGIVNTAFARMKGAFPDVYMIEDCAQAMGSMVGSKSVGSMGDISFFSFNKGKNMPLVKGGCIATNNQAISRAIEDELGEIKMASSQASLRAKMAILSLMADPYLYGFFHGLLDTWRDKKPPADIDVAGFTDLQASFGSSLLKMMDKLSEKRYKNGMKILKELSGVGGIILPRIDYDTRPAFNRLPIVFKDIEKRETVRKALWESGIETAALYPEPLHHMFELGYGKDEFPNAAYIASHSWTFPAHSGVGDSDIDKMIEIIRSIVK